MQPARHAIPMLISCGLALLASASPALAGELREWTDAAGKFTRQAEFVSFKEGMVQLKQPDGAVIAVALAKLSADDQEYVKIVSDPALAALYAPFAGRWKNGDFTLSISASGRGSGELIFKVSSDEEVVSTGSFKIVQDAQDKSLYISIPVGIKRAVLVLTVSADGQSLTMEPLGDGPIVGKIVYKKAK